jgi:hypothetical protein
MRLLHAGELGKAALAAIVTLARAPHPLAHVKASHPRANPHDVPNEVTPDDEWEREIEWDGAGTD